MSHPIDSTGPTGATPAADTARPTDQRHAGAFDLRNVIGALLGIYGLVLVACYFFLDPGVTPETGLAKSAADNLWSGLAMLAVAAAFMLWAKLNPITLDS